MNSAVARATVTITAAAIVVTFSGCGPSSHPPPEAGSGPKPPIGSSDSSRNDKVVEEPNGGGAAWRDRDQGETRIRFADVTQETGVRFTARNGQEAGHRAILESLGTGVALCDVDGDGRLDLFFPGGGDFTVEPAPHGLTPALFLSRGRDALRYEDATAAAGLSEPKRYSHGAHAADYDNDGFVDLLVTGYGGLTLWRNHGDGTFGDATADAGLTDDSWSTAAAWGDFNRDGALDLFVVHYVDWSFRNHPHCPGTAGTPRDVCPPGRFKGLTDLMCVSNGDGTFRDATRAAGIVPEGKGLGALAADLDDDGDLDLYVANDTTPNFLYRNDGRAKFDEVGFPSGTALGDNAEADGSMGVDLIDADRDGRPDIWVANFEDQSFALYLNLGDAQFRHASHELGITAVGKLFVGFGTTAADFDLNGHEELFVTNGHVMQLPRASPLKQLPLLFERRGPVYRDVAAGAGEPLRRTWMGRGAAVGDLDDDGDVDLVLSPMNEPAAVLRNESNRAGRWLSVRLIGVDSPRLPIGARVKARLSDGTTITRQLKGGGSYLSTSDTRLGFGLGNSDERVNLWVRWPSGREQDLENVATGRPMTLVEPSDHR